VPRLYLSYLRGQCKALFKVSAGWVRTPTKPPKNRRSQQKTRILPSAVVIKSILCWRKMKEASWTTRCSEAGGLKDHVSQAIPKTRCLPPVKILAWFLCTLLVNSAERHCLSAGATVRPNGRHPFNAE